MSYRVGQRLRLNGWQEAVVCDVREDGTAYVTTERENERIMISDKGHDLLPVETRVPDRCKCLASSYDEHLNGIRWGAHAAHVYSGPFWQTNNDTQETE